MKNSIKTPAWVDSLIDGVAPGELAEEIRGDLYEMFQSDIASNGESYARRRYMYNAFGFLFKRFFWRQSTIFQNNTLMMIGSYFRMASRTLMAYKATSLINILGLVIGIAAAIVIFSVVHFELSFDRFHSDADRIYRMVRVSGDDMSEFRTGISYPVPAALKEEIPVLEEITSMRYMGGAYVDVMDENQKAVAKFREEGGCITVEPNFFKVFDFKDTGFRWLEGNPDNALVEPFNVVLTETMAKKYFPEGNAVGKSIRFEKYYDAKVTGVVTDFPANTDFPFTILIAYSTLGKMMGDRANDWVSVSDEHHTYVKLSDGTTPEEVETAIAKVHAANTPKDIHQNRHYLLQKLRDVHHQAQFGTYTGRTISESTILGFILVGIFLILTAAINYINLATAQSTMRSKEIGLRKVLGGLRANLIGQFMVETFVLVLLAAVVGLLLSEVLIIQFGDLINFHPVGFNFLDPFVLLLVCSIIFSVTFFAGLYPSLILSNFNPVHALKSKFNLEGVGKVSLRKVLVVAQFTITQMLVVGTFIVISQMNFFHNGDIGFNKDATINLELPNTSQPRHVEILRNQLNGQSFAANVTFSYTLPSGLGRNQDATGIGLPDAQVATDYAVFDFQPVDPNYLNTYEIKLLAGRNLEWSDSTGNILINRTLARSLNLGTPEEALNKELKMGGGDRVVVVGVIEDFYSNSLKSPVDNMVMLINRYAFNYCSVKLNIPDGTTLSSVIEKIEDIWHVAYPDHIMNYSFLEERIEAFYAQEEKYAQLFQIFSIVFLLIGCLGLYGLITFVVNRKGKEVAIRKVLGAKIGQILFMFSKEYLILILISFLIAVPIAYYAVDSWLSNFKNRIELQWWLFLLPGVLVIGIALTVVVIKSLKTASANPVDQLKYE